MNWLRWLWRRLPPPDKRRLLQQLNDPTKRRRFLRSPAYQEFLRQESAYWDAAEAVPPSEEINEGQTNSPESVLRSPWEHPRVRQALAERAGYGENGIWGWMARNIPKVDKAFVPAGGNGDHARLLIDYGIARQVLACDIVENTIHAVQAKSGDYPIEFIWHDLNFPPSDLAIDICFASHALHHLISLEDFFRAMRKSLGSQGLLVMEEYVGPCYLDYPKVVRNRVAETFDRLPEKYRRGKDLKTIMPKLYLPDRWYTQRHTPFEAIRSDQIMPALRQEFDVTLERPMGGSLFMPLLSGILHNISLNSPEDDQIVKQIMDLDWALTQKSEIPNSFIFVVASPKNSQNQPENMV